MLLSVPASVVSPAVLTSLVKGNYEGAELRLVRQRVQPQDRILELGAGLGFLACAVKRGNPGIAYTAIEANPTLIPVIQENFRVNGVDVHLLHGAASTTEGTILFHAAEDFWASSSGNISQPHSDIEVPSVDLRPLVAELKPTMMIIDIEGGELDLLPRLDLSGVDVVIMELHPAVYGHHGATKVIRSLLEKGFNLDVQQSGSQVFLFERPRAGSGESGGG